MNRVYAENVIEKIVSAERSAAEIMMHNQAFPIDCLKRIPQIFIVLHYRRKCLDGRFLRLCVMEQEHYFGILIRF